MTNERMKELLNNIVEFVSVANDTKEQIEELLKYGFEGKDLVRDFGYSKADVEDVTGEPVPDEEPKKYKLHARVTREIEVTEDQMERLCNYLCDSSEHKYIEDIRSAFTDGIDSGNYDDAGYVPQPWITDDFMALPEDDEIRMYLEENQCIFDQIDL